jgi:hypothetical protein
MPNNELKQQNLENALDYLCRATGRDIFVILPEKVEDCIPYLLKEIAITLKSQTPLMPFIEGDIFNEAKLEEANILLFSIIETNNDGGYKSNYKNKMQEIRAKIEKRFDVSPEAREKTINYYNNK